MKNTESQFNKIITSNLFRLDGETIDICAELNALIECIENEEETNWDLGEGEEATLDSLLIGAYWSLTECHCGQNSAEYETLCIIGRVFNPGMSCLDEDKDGEKLAYDLISKNLINAKTKG